MTDNMQRARERISDMVLEVLACEPCIGTCESEESFAHRIAVAAAMRLAVPEWRPIETAPKDGSGFLAFWETNTRLDDRSYGGIQWVGSPYVSL